MVGDFFLLELHIVTHLYREVLIVWSPTFSPLSHHPFFNIFDLIPIFMYFTAIVPLFCGDVISIEKLYADLPNCPLWRFERRLVFCSAPFILWKWNHPVSVSLLDFTSVVVWYFHPCVFVSLWPAVWSSIFWPLVWGWGLGVSHMCVWGAVKPKDTPTVIIANHLGPVKRDYLWIRHCCFSALRHCIYFCYYYTFTRQQNNLKTWSTHRWTNTTKIIFRAYLRSPSRNAFLWAGFCWPTSMTDNPDWESVLRFLDVTALGEGGGRGDGARPPLALSFPLSKNRHGQ